MSYDNYVRSIPKTLFGYWRLGESASPFADISGHPDGPTDMIRQARGNPMVTDVPGIPAGGDLESAVRFTAAIATNDYLRSASSVGGGYRYNFAGGTAQTLAAWVKPGDPGVGSAFVGPVVGSWYQVSGPIFAGYRLWVLWPSRRPAFQRTNVSGTPNIALNNPAVNLAADDWSLIVGTYDPAAGAKLYVNGVLVASDTTLFTADVPNLSAVIGGVEPISEQSANGVYGFYGSIDEVAIWGGVLSPAEINGLYTQGLSPPPSTCNYIYTPDPDFYGTDTFTFKGNDGLYDSNTATITIHVRRDLVVECDELTLAASTGSDLTLSSSVCE